MSKIKFAFIGGSGLYKANDLERIKWIKVVSSFGKPSSKVCVGVLNGIEVAFLPRHGVNHNIPPSLINYRANIEVLKKLGVENIISLSAVGSFEKRLYQVILLLLINTLTRLIKEIILSLMMILLQSHSSKGSDMY